MASAAQDAKAEDVAILDLRELSSSFDYFVICSVSSSRRMRTVAEDIRDAVKVLGTKGTQLEGEPDGGWVLIDGGPVIAHLFTSEVRVFYGLERLWADAPRISIPGIKVGKGERVKRGKGDSPALPLTHSPSRS